MLLVSQRHEPINQSAIHPELTLSSSNLPIMEYGFKNQSSSQPDLAIPFKCSFYTSSAAPAGSEVDRRPQLQLHLPSIIPSQHLRLPTIRIKNLPRFNPTSRWYFPVPLIIHLINQYIPFFRVTTTSKRFLTCEAHPIHRSKQDRNGFQVS
jgi:hypothetical protein